MLAVLYKLLLSIFLLHNNRVRLNRRKIGLITPLGVQTQARPEVEDA